MVKLTKRTVDAARPRERDYFLWDGDLPGFALRVLPSGRRSYVIQYRSKGRTRRFTIGVHGVLTAEEARKRARRHLVEVGDGADPSAVRRAGLCQPTVAEFADRYLAQHAEPKKKPSSVSGDRRNLKRHVLPALGPLHLVEVSRADIAALHHSLRSTPYLANRVLALCSKMFNLAERWGLRPDGSNPCRHVERFREQKRERFLSEAELARLGGALAAAERGRSELPSALAAIRLLVFTGCRKGEILALRWDDVDLERGLIWLRDSKTGARTLPLNAPTRSLLAGLSIRGCWVLPGLDPSKPVVGVTRAWHRIRTKAKLEDVRIHDLRHSFASVGAGMGASLPIIGSLLGHTQPITTQRYAHLSDDPLRQASEAIGARIATAMQGTPGARVSSLKKRAWA